MNTSYLSAGNMPSWQLLLLSAKSELALASGIEQLIGFLRTSRLRAGQGGTFADMSFTLLAGRELFDQRLALVCRDADDATKVLTSHCQGKHSERVWRLAASAKSRPLAFLFTDWNVATMHVAGAIFASQAVFRAEVARCIGVLDDAAAKAWLLALLGGGAAPSQGQAMLGQLSEHPLEKSPEQSPEHTLYAPIASFVFGYALASLWQSLGVNADVLIGEGTGEFVAAHLAGGISLEDALYLARLRGRSLQYGVEPEARIRNRKPLVPHRDYLSVLAGKIVTANAMASPEYWLERVSMPVNAGIAPPSLASLAPLSQLAEMTHRLVLDIGMGTVIDPAQAACGASGVVNTAPAPDGVYWMLSTLGALALNGVKIDWRAYFADKRVKRISLPTYCFEAHPHWFVAQAPSKPTLPKPQGNLHQNTKTAVQPALYRSRLENFLLETCEDLLGISSLNLHQNVMQLGMDSMNVMQLSLRIEQAYQLTIAPHHLFAKPNIGSLLEKILTLRPDLADVPTLPVGKLDHGAHHAELADMAHFVANLSEAEVNRLLMELNAL